MNIAQNHMSSQNAYDRLARYYDLQHSLLVEDIPMYIQLARDMGSKAKILEIGCGTGRVMLPLIGTGFTVVGVDESRHMLQIALDRIQQISPTPLINGTASGDALVLGGSAFICGDARTLHLVKKFDIAIIALNTFLHNLTRDDQLAMLQTAYAHLLVGGKLVIDLPPNDEMANQPDDGEYDYETTIIDPIQQTEIQKFVSSRLFWASQQQELSYRIHENLANGDKKETIVSFRLRHVFKYEMELLLMNVGFTQADIHWYGDYDLGDYEDLSRRMIVIAQKQ
jgi:SAM-dependent methyltransferase